MSFKDFRGGGKLCVENIKNRPKTWGAIFARAYPLCAPPPYLTDSRWLSLSQNKLDFKLNSTSTCSELQNVGVVDSLGVQLVSTLLPSSGQGPILYAPYPTIGIPTTFARPSLQPLPYYHPSPREGTFQDWYGLVLNRNIGKCS